MKIRIIGGPGSGKTFLAKRLSAELGIPHYDLDDLQWDNRTAAYGTKRPAEERDRLFKDILNRENWILEGVYYAWCAQSFADADRIYLLRVPRYRYRFRIIRRFVRRKLGLEQGKKETLKSLRQLLKWADKYQKVNLPEINKLLEPCSDKTVRYPDRS